MSFDILYYTSLLNIISVYTSYINRLKSPSLDSYCYSELLKALWVKNVLIAFTLLGKMLDYSLLGEISYSLYLLYVDNSMF